MSLLRPRSSDRTLSEYHRHASFMVRTVGGAIALIRKHGTFKAALAAGDGNEAAKAIEYFARMRPDQGIVAAVRTARLLGELRCPFRLPEFNSSRRRHSQ
jgi:hypothetical protein